MALGGDLKNINLADIFQTLSMNQQVGTLVVRSSGKEKRIFFSGHGVSLSSGRTIPGFRLGRYLRGIEKITEDDLRIALGEQRKTGELLGKVLTKLGLCTATDVEEIVRYHAAEELYEIFTWNEGEFEFLEGTSSDALDRPSPYALMQFDPGGIVMEAARRLDEWERYKEVLPDDDDLLVRTGTEGPTIDSDMWGPDVAKVYTMIDGSQSVKEILDAYHLSHYDTAMSLRDLATNDLVRTCTLEELTRAAWGFLDDRNVSKATKCLLRAHRIQPDDLAILKQLTDCYEKLDEKKTAAKHLIDLGRHYLEHGKPPDAIEALEKAEKYDPGSEEAPILLIRAFQIAGQPDAVAEKARTAAAILCDKEEFEKAIDICRAGIAGAPAHTGLRIVLANAFLGCGQKENALEELEEIASHLEETRSYRKLEEVYKKILQLDSSRREYLRRLQELKEGAYRRRQRLIRIAILSGAACLLLLLSLLVFTSGASTEDRLSQARDLFAQGHYAAAEAIAREVLEEESESPLAQEATSLLFRISQARKGGTNRPDEAEMELLDRIESLYRPADEAFAVDDYRTGLEKLLLLAEFLRSDEAAGLEKRVGKEKWTRLTDEYENHVRGLLTRYADVLEAVGGSVRGELDALDEAKLRNDDFTKVEKVMDDAEVIGKNLSVATLQSTIDLAEAVELEITGAAVTSNQRLAKTAEILEQLYERAQRIHHRARAIVRETELQQRFTRTRETISNLKNDGKLDEAEAAAREFLAECERLRTRKPSEFYRPVFEKLCAGGKGQLDLDGRVQRELDEIHEVRKLIAKSEKLVLEGRYEESNELLRELIRAHYLIDFTELVRLSLHIRTNPLGAAVIFVHGENPPLLVGETGPEGVLVRYPPYGATQVLIQLESFETETVTIQDFNDVHKPTPELELQKLPAWVRRGGGTFEASPTDWGESVLLTSRDGSMRGYRKETGETTLEIDTDQLSGFSAPAVFRGDTAFLASQDGRLLVIDLKTRETLWTFEAEGGIGVPPFLFGDLVVLVEESGRVCGVREGQQVWSLALPGRVKAEPARLPDGLVVGTTSGHVVRIDTEGKVLWDREPGGDVYSPVSVGPEGGLYVGTEGAELFRLDAEDGAEVWRAELDQPVRGLMAFRDGRLYAGTLSGTLFGVVVEDGREEARIQVSEDAELESGVALGASRLYVVDRNGILHAVSPVRGREWSFPLEARCLTRPWVENGRVFVPTMAGDLFVFRE